MSELKPGDKLGRFTVDKPVAIWGLEGCKSPRCTRAGMVFDGTKITDYGECRGYHCAICLEPCSMMGHDCPEDPDKLAAA